MVAGVGWLVAAGVVLLTGRMDLRFLAVGVKKEGGEGIRRRGVFGAIFLGVVMGEVGAKEEEAIGVDG